MKTTCIRLGLLACLFLSFSTSIQAQDIKPFKAEEVKPNPEKEKTSATSPGKGNKSQSPNELNFFFGLYQYWVPGTSYTTPDYANRQLILHNSAGTGVLPGGIRINKDRTYVWNSSWDGKVIKGTWKATGDSGYPIELVNAQEGKNWRVGRFNDKGVDIHVWDGSTWYNGKKINK